MDGVTSISFGHERIGEAGTGRSSSDTEKKPYGLLNILDSWDLLD